jgi:hypothetical protein
LSGRQKISNEPLQAWADDVNRLNDVNRNNNKLVTAFSLP